MIGTCVSYQRRFRFDSDVALLLDNPISENFQYSLCRLTGNQLAVDLTNLYNMERSLLSYFVVLAQLDRASHYECEGCRFDSYRQLPS